MNPGIAYALGAYVLWGLAPLYFRMLRDVGTVEILAHRVSWSLLLMCMLVALLGKFGAMARDVRQPRVFGRFVLTALLVSINWGIYIWSVNAHRVVDASLGYYINPLVSVALGTLVLRERLRSVQWMAVALATAGVVWLTYQAGAPPWIALLLAVSFALYGLLRKTASLGAIEGLAIETLILAPFALGYVMWVSLHGAGALVTGSTSQIALLVISGPVTAIPLMCFAAATRRLSLSTVGLMQYLSPTMQLLIGVLAFDEPFPAARAIGFALIWTGLVILAVDSLGVLPRLRGWVLGR